MIVSGDAVEKGGVVFAEVDGGDLNGLPVDVCRNLGKELFVANAGGVFAVTEPDDFARGDGFWRVGELLAREEKGRGKVGAEIDRSNLFDDALKGGLVRDAGEVGDG